MKTDEGFKARNSLILILVLLAASLPGTAQLLSPPSQNAGTPTRLIVRAPGGLNVVQLLCSLLPFGCSLLQGLGDPAGQLFVISTPLTELVFDLEDLLGITHVEIDRLLSLLPVAPLISNATQPPESLSNTNLVPFYGAMVWNGYAAQPAAGVVRAGEAQNRFNVTGNGIIGIIDTGVDPNHPALVPVLVPGYDFTRNSGCTPSPTCTGSEMADLNESTVAVVDGGSPVPMNGTTMAVLDQSTVAVVDGCGCAAFGHGTMVAGIVHLVAPTSYIMPLKAFHADGTGYTSDIIRAVYFAVQQNVNVLNMSFSMPGYSAELENSLDYAASQSVVSAAAAGNEGQQMTVYPAGFSGDVMGVGSTSLDETRSTFSNYGSDVWVAAPGEGIISTYPFGTYAAGWGTSFSTPFVTGTVGLLTNLQANLNEQKASSDIAHAEYIGANLGHGELDVVHALDAAEQNQH